MKRSNNHTKVIFFLFAILSGFKCTNLFSQSPNTILSSDLTGPYNSDIPTPEQVFGCPLGTHPANYEEMSRYFSALDKASFRVQQYRYGTTYEGRALNYLIISSEKNMQKLNQLRQQINVLSDPRGFSAKEIDSILSNTPVIVWLGYGIHGDELSSTDAALQVAYQLTAASDSTTLAMLDRIIILIEPSQNPDGRARAIQQIVQWNGVILNTDIQSLQHAGTWPWGRGNHYLFDMNRDLVPMVHEETQNRMKVILQWHPQVVIDSHEMGAMDTYLFSPPREPLHPLITNNHKKWWSIFSSDQADAFNRQSWRYYTKDWSENWYPGYSDAWVLFTGAIGILYEQAGVDGTVVKQYDSHILTYKESVEHHIVSSMANLQTAANHRQELLQDYYTERARALNDFRKEKYKTFLIDPSKNLDDAYELAEKMSLLNVTVRVAEQQFELANTIDYWQGAAKTRRFPIGTIFASTDQPSAALLHAFMDFDPHMKNEFVQSERYELEKYGRSRIYDVTSWSLPIAYSLDAFWSENVPKVASIDYAKYSKPASHAIGEDKAYAYVINYLQPRATLALAKLFDAGYQIYAAEKSFKIQGATFVPGSFVLFNGNNPNDMKATLTDIAKKTQVDVVGVKGGLSEDGPDLGSRRFRLLKQPRLAIVGNQPISPNNFGELWYLIDKKLGMRYSLLDFGRLIYLDLNLYNVIIFPSCRQNAQEVQSNLGNMGMAKIKQWIENGGTLIAIGSSAAVFADTSAKMSQVRLRHQVLDKLEIYQKEWLRLKAAELPVIDSLLLWSNRVTKQDGISLENGGKGETKNIKDLQLWDQSLIKYHPRGVMVKAVLDKDQWLTFGLEKQIAVILDTDIVLMAKEPVQVSARLAEPDELRLSGLLWPEGRLRCANTAYATRESMGRGQIILFADEPTFRGYLRGAEKLVSNAMLLGPGFGTSPSLLW